MAKSRFFSCRIPQKSLLLRQNKTMSMQKKTVTPTEQANADQLLRHIEQSDIIVVREMPRFFGTNEDFVYPHIILTLILSGTARAMYDMRVITHQKNDLSIILPGHIMHPMDCSDDFSYALLFISPKMLDDLRFSTFSHDIDKFHSSPVCRLTDEQAQHLLAIVDQLNIIARYTEEEMPHRYQTLLAQLAVGYEFLNLYRRDQDRQWTEKRCVDTFNRFCDLVVEHYRESREIKYYADLLNLTPKHLSKVVRTATNGITPVKWIEQYVTAQAKRLIETGATSTIQETAYMLGFSESSSFYRYFKRTTGMTAKEYRDKHPIQKL